MKAVKELISNTDIYYIRKKILKFISLKLVSKYIIRQSA